MKVRCATGGGQYFQDLGLHFVTDEVDVDASLADAARGVTDLSVEDAPAEFETPRVEEDHV